jgi:GTP-binding protein YchF
MKIGIVGFAGSGKTTIFNALTGLDAPTGFGGGKVNLGAIKVPDKRVDRLAELANPKKVTYAEIAFADVPGGRSGSGLDPETMGKIREMDALVHVIRGFDDGAGLPDTVAALRAFEDELIIGDMQVAEKRIERLKKDRSNPKQQETLERCLEALSNETPLRRIELSEEEHASLSAFAFVSLKPMLAIVSVPEEDAAKPLSDAMNAAAAACGFEVMPLCGSVEAEIAALDPSDQKEFLADLGLAEPASTRFIQAAFRMLNLISFLTHGPDECRAWPVPRGSTAVRAAAAVHSDIARGFIRAEVTSFDDMDKLENEAACKKAGKFRVEGKEYIVQDGDICHFRFNV